MKINVYTIAKNEEHNCEKFMASVKDADGVYILDTGSSDNTVDTLRDLGANVFVSDGSNFRFDTYRNISLSLVPEDTDVCFCIDLDETVTEGWRNKLESAWSMTPGINLLSYPYIWDHRPDGSPGTTFWYEKIHARQGFRWVYPVHEVLVCDNKTVKGTTEDFEVHHYPDVSKKRDYLRLLELSVIEDQDNDRHVHYLGREFMFNKDWDNAIKWFTRHVNIKDTWPPEKAASYRYMANCYAQLNNFALEELCLLRACTEAPGEREPWVDFGKYCLRTEQWAGGVYAAQRALALENKPNHYICDGYAWNEGPFDILSVCYFYMGLRTRAFANAVEALKRAPYNERIQFNYDFIRSNMQIDEV